MLHNLSFLAAARSAWYETNVPPRTSDAESYEQGGWIYMNVRTGQITIQRAVSNRDLVTVWRTQHPREDPPLTREAVIRWLRQHPGERLPWMQDENDTDPHNRTPLSNPPIVPGSVVVGNFHTHPSTGGPSDPDLAIADRDGVPGFVIHYDRIIPYGPQSRMGGLSGEPGYPLRASRFGSAGLPGRR